MRPDMFRVIVERPRLRVGYWRTLRNHYRAAKHFKLDEDGEVCDEYCRTKLPIKHRRIGYNGKELNENLSPLRKFIQSQLGRRWDDIYSEICATLDTGSTVKQHVRGHLSDFVYTKVYREDGFLWATYYGVPMPIGYGDWYVDPVTGILQESKLKIRVEYRSYPLIQRPRAIKLDLETMDFGIDSTTGRVVVGQ